jgi:hypothetical protein
MGANEPACPQCGWKELLTDGGAYPVDANTIRHWQRIRCTGPACGWKSFEEWEKELKR